MSFVTLTLNMILPLLLGLLCALPLFLLLRMLWGNRNLRMLLWRYRLLNRGWKPIFLERHPPGSGR
jgi:hypothetical protein